MGAFLATAKTAHGIGFPGQEIAALHLDYLDFFEKNLKNLIILISQVIHTRYLRYPLYILSKSVFLRIGFRLLLLSNLRRGGGTLLFKPD